VTEVRVAGRPVILTGWPVTVSVTSVGDGLADARKADLNCKL